MELYKGKSLPFRPMTGDVVLRRNEFKILEPSTYLSTAIRSVDGYPYNHCGVVAQREDGSMWLYESKAEGVVRHPLFDDGTLNTSSETYVAFMRPKGAVSIDFPYLAEKYLGTKYDYTALVYHQVVYRIPRYLNMWYNTKFPEGRWVGSTRDYAIKKMVCSEYVGMLHKMEDWWKLSTGDIAKSGKFDLLWEEKRFLTQEPLFPIGL